MRRYTIGFELGGPVQMHPLQALPWPAYWDGLIDPEVDGSRFARVAGRAGGTAARVTSSGIAGGRTEVYVASAAPSLGAGAAAIHRFAFKADGLPSQSVGIARSGLPWSVYLRPDGRLVFFDGSPNGLDRTALSTPPYYGVNPDAASLRNAWATVEPVVTPGVWAFVEVAWLPPTQGFRYFIARVNGQTVVSQPRVPGAVATSRTDEMYVGLFEEGTGLDFAVAYDDLACNDATGAQQNGYPGAGRVLASFPDQDVYADNSWAPGTQYSLVGAPGTAVYGGGGEHNLTTDPGPPWWDTPGGAGAAPYYEALNNVPPLGVDDSQGLPISQGGDGNYSHQANQVTGGAGDVYDSAPGWSVAGHIVLDPGPPVVFAYPPGHTDYETLYVNYRLTHAEDRLDVSCVLPASAPTLAFMVVMSHGGGNPGQNFGVFHVPEFQPEPQPGERGYVDFAPGHGGDWPSGWAAFVGQTRYEPPPGRVTMRVRRKTPLRDVASPVESIDFNGIDGMCVWSLCQAALVYEDQANPAAIVPPTGGFMAIV